VEVVSDNNGMMTLGSVKIQSMLQPMPEPGTRSQWLLPITNTLEVKWKVALYVDELANHGQQDALTQIFSGQAGGHLAGLAPLSFWYPFRLREQ
jgi:hypothetical protein